MAEDRAAGKSRRSGQRSIAALYEAIAARAPDDASAIMRRLLLHAREDTLETDGTPDAGD